MTRRGYEPRHDFRLDVAYGEQQETHVHELLASIQRGGLWVEVKADRYLNAEIFIETQDRRKGQPYPRPTGLRTTSADLFILTKPALNAVHIYRADDLRGLLDELAFGSPRWAAMGGDCPTIGYLNTVTEIDRALISKARAAS